MTTLRRRSTDGTASTVGRLALQLVIPAILAAGGAYMAVGKQIVRLEEQFKGFRREIQIRNGYVDRDLKSLHANDKLLADEFKAHLMGEKK